MGEVMNTYNELDIIFKNSNIIILEKSIYNTVFII